MDADEVIALAHRLGSKDWRAREALAALCDHGAPASGLLFSARSSCAPEVRAPVDALLARWALDREGERFRAREA